MATDAKEYAPIELTDEEMCEAVIRGLRTPGPRRRIEKRMATNDKDYDVVLYLDCMHRIMITFDEYYENATFETWPCEKCKP